MRRLIMALLVLAGTATGTLQAQRVVESPFSSFRPLPPLRPLRPLRPPHSAPALLVGGGVVGGVAGLFAGAVVGAKLSEQNNCEDCGLEGAVYGAIAGWSVGIPMGVHMVNGGRGSYGRSLLASLGIGTVGLAAAFATNSGAVLLLVPVAQIVTSVQIERKTERLREAP
jgi:hypothetical protein